jgi:hypothetical protein
MDWKGLVSTVAPWIGTALGGPLGGMAVGAVADALGLSDKTTAAVQAALSGATPDQMLALKNADNNFAVQMQSLGFGHIEELQKLANDDMASARQREMTVKDKTPQLLILFVTLGFFGILGFMLFKEIPDKNQQILNVMLGSLGTAWLAGIYYYFGSSTSSERKTELIAMSPAIEK